MCNCKNIDIGSYDNTIVLNVPEGLFLEYNNQERELRKTVQVDRCLVDEIQYLWSKNIETTGCCCGHNKQLPYIGVTDDCIQQMKDMGYVVQKNPLCSKSYEKIREDSFYPKDIEIEPEMIASYVDWLLRLIKYKEV